MSPWHVVLVALAGWLNREQQKIIEYLKEENRVLREQLGTKRLRFNDEQRRRLAVKGKEAILKQQGIDPAPERSKQIYWKTFLRSHWDAIAACDFFTVEVLTFEVLTFAGLTRCYVFFVIELATRRVELAGISHQPHGAWMLQVARNLLDSVDGFLMRKRFLLLDRDPLYTSQFRALLTSAGVTPIRLPPSSPNLNAYAERFVRSIKSECLNKLVLLGEGHLRAVVREYVAHYHEERNHQGLAGQLILPPANLNQPGPIVCRERLGGLLRFYHQKAA